MVMVVVKVVVVKVGVGGGGGDVLLVAAVHLGEVVAVFVCQHWWSHHVGSNSERTGGA
jgi:NAD(P)H-hydrate repair Nnr-like enzyme with NAD(P)H-hydrate epimerase domain